MFDLRMCLVLLPFCKPSLVSGCQMVPTLSHRSRQFWPFETQSPPFLSQDVLGCVCVNPGRLTKGQVGGTYGRLYLRRQTTDGEGRRSPCVAAQVVRI